MLIGRIEGATLNLGKPKDWDETKQGKCGTLPVRVELTPLGPAMTSAWFPEPKELEAIAAGAPVYLTVYGNGHPPVALWTGQAPPALETGLPLKK